MKKVFLFLFVIICGNVNAQGWSVFAATSFASGDGTENNPYIISTPQQLALLAKMIEEEHDNYADKSYQLGADINLQGYEWDLSAGTSETSPFKGKFDGAGKTISNLLQTAYLAFPGDFCGLFGVTKDAEIKNLTINYALINLPRVTGTLIGFADETKIIDCFVRNADITQGSDNTGGFIGYATKTSVSGSEFSGSVSGTGIFTGGFIGFGKEIILIDCSSEGTVTGIENVGGFIGEIQGNSTITSCFSTVNTSGIRFIGGFIGYVDAAEPVVIASCYATGSVIGLAENVGGFIGYFNGRGSIEESFAKGAVTGLSGVGGFMGRGATDNDAEVPARLKNCYSIGSVTGAAANIGGFIGSNYKLMITNCYAGGTVSGKENVGGFSGFAQGSVIFGCYANGAVEGDMYVGGFGGYISDGASIVASLASGNVDGNIIVGGFLGTNNNSAVSACFTNGLMINENNSGGFTGNNLSGNYTNCHFDRQSSGVVVEIVSGSEADGINASPTSMLTQSSLTGFSANDWLFIQGFYPQLKYFAEHTDDAIRTKSELFAVPLVFANDDELCGNVQTVFQLTDKTPAGKTINWTAGSFDKITFHNNYVYAEASQAWRTLIFRVDDMERAFNFRSINGLFSVDILDLRSSLPHVGNEFNYFIECGSNDEFVLVDISLYPYATSVPESPVRIYPNEQQEIVVTTPDGQTKNYLFKAEKRLNPDIYVQRWQHTLAVNNNFDVNGGYNFKAYQWYKNGEILPDTKGYIFEQGGLSLTATYHVVLTTQDDEKITVCPAVITEMPVMTSVWPNPARRGHSMNVDTGLTDDEILSGATIQIFNMAGGVVAKKNINASSVEITAPETPGHYILQITSGVMSQTHKIIVEQ